MMGGQLAGKRALVTGGASGIGLATARLFAGEGATVCIADCDEAALSAAIELVKSHGEASGFLGDVASAADTQAMASTAAGPPGRLDIVFCSAGIPSRGTVETLSMEEWDRVLAVNLTGTYQVIRAAVPYMKAQGGSIITTGSEMSFVADPEALVYNASKGAVIMLTKSLGLDLIRYGIRVNALCPGITATPLVEAEIKHSRDEDATRRAFGSWAPIGRMATPEEQAAGALFLASEASSFAVGTSLILDGGYTAR